MNMLPPIVVVPGRRRRRGRRPISMTEKPAAHVHLTMDPDEYDRMFDLARARRTSIQDLLRSALKHLIADERGGSVGIEIKNRK